MKKITLLITTLCSFLSLSSASLAAPEKCKFEVDSSTVKVEWTAFKTTEKVGVNGSFGEVILSGKQSKTGTFKAFLEQMGAEINLSGVAQVKTGNPARDKTLFESFFSLFKKKPVLKGTLKGVKGTDSEGDLNLNLTMNQKTKAVPMKYTRDDKGNFMAKGAIELNDFALQNAFASLHKACEDLHKGKDGVSKTWSEVEIKISAMISQKCGS